MGIFKVRSTQLAFLLPTNAPLARLVRLYGTKLRSDAHRSSHQLLCYPPSWVVPPRRSPWRRPPTAGSTLMVPGRLTAGPGRRRGDPSPPGLAYPPWCAGELRRELERCPRSGRQGHRHQGRVETRGKILNMIMISERTAKVTLVERSKGFCTSPRRLNGGPRKTLGYDETIREVRRARCAHA